MTSINLLLLLPLLLSATISSSSAATITTTISGKLIPGGWEPIKDVTHPHIVGLGEFAISEHDKEAGDGLVFVKVSSGEQQVVSGINYKLIIVAEKDKVAGNYEAVVWEQEWKNFKKLTSFKPVNS